MNVLNVEVITPRDAEKMLATMIKNRPVSDAKTIEYAIAMEEGKWSVNGETIKLDRNGHLFDGQHRLRACVLAEKPFKTFVARGIEDPNAFATVDVGKNRSHGDILGIAGFSNPAHCATAATIIYLFQNGQLDWKGPQGHGARVVRTATSKATANMRTMPTRTVLIQKDVLLEFSKSIAEGLSSAVRIGNSFKARKLVSPPLMAGVYYLLREKSFDDAEKFFYDLGEGIGLTKTDPVYHLRERLIDNKSEGGPLNRWTIIGLMLKAWNKRRAGEELRYLKVGDGEGYPKKLK